MQKQLIGLIPEIEVTGDIHKDIIGLLSGKRYEELSRHSIKVANEAKRIAGHYGVSQEKAFIAGLLHDIGRIVPLDKSIDICNQFGIQVLEEEKLAPSLLHPKLSKLIASDIFQVDADICSAIECHSTLKANAKKLDMVLFIADKTSWDRSYNGEFVEEMLEGLYVSLECSAIKFIEYICDGNTEILHPWAIEAYDYLKSVCK